MILYIIYLFSKLFAHKRACAKHWTFLKYLLIHKILKSILSIIPWPWISSRIYTLKRLHIIITTCYRLECVFMNRPHYKISSDPASWHVGPLLTLDMIWVPSTIHCSGPVLSLLHGVELDPALVTQPRPGWGRGKWPWAAGMSGLRRGAQAQFPGAGRRGDTCVTCQHGPCDLTICKYSRINGSNEYYLPVYKGLRNEEKWLFSV